MRKLQIIFIIDIEPICQNKWNIYFNKNLPWRKIWTNLRINQATRKTNQLSWKIIHDTEAKLQNKNGRSMNGLCHFCDTLNVKTFILRLHSHTTKLGKNHIDVKKLHEVS